MASLIQVTEEGDQIQLQSMSDVRKLDDVEAPLANFVTGNELLMFAKALGERFLAEA